MKICLLSSEDTYCQIFPHHATNSRFREHAGQQLRSLIRLLRADFDIPDRGLFMVKMIIVFVAAAPCMSTPCQRAYADLARLVTVKIRQCPWVWRWKIRKIKGLVHKWLICLSYWNHWGFGS